MSRRRESRVGRAIRAMMAVAAVLVFASTGAADGVTVPIRLQAELLLKVAAYDRSLGRRAGDRIQIVLVSHPKEPSSLPAVLEMQRALMGLGSVSGLPHDEHVVSFSMSAALLAYSREKRASIIYFGPGFDGEIEELRATFDGQDVLTVSAVPGDVPKGIVLGFDLVSSRPKLLIHLTQARRQKCDFRADILRLVRVYE